jgi:hypothetical protein
MRLVLGAFLQATARRGSNRAKRDSDSCHVKLNFLYSCMTLSRRLKLFMLLNSVKKEEEGRSCRHCVSVARDDASGC